MQKIVPNFWFDDQAEEAANFYVSIFKNSKIRSISRYGKSGAEISGKAEGSVLTVEFELDGFAFTALNGGPLFKINPSLSFILNFDPSKDPDAREHLDALWQKFSEGGEALMPLGEYPFSKHYGWIQDRYGVSWQLMLTNPEREDRPFITPSLLFVGDVCGKAEEAIDLYVSVFKNSKRGQTARYGAGAEPDREGTLMFADFQLEHQWFAAMDSAHEHKFAFNEAVSLLVDCETQEEIDALWQKLSAVPASEQCGWLKDKYGVSWQIVPTVLGKLISGDPQKSEKVMAAMLQMKKLDIAELQRAYDTA